MLRQISLFSNHFPLLYSFSFTLISVSYTHLDVYKRQDKDSVFRALFNDEDKLRELYNVPEDTVYGEDNPIFIETLENGIFVDAVKDQTFRIGDKFVVLIEHKRSLRSLL